MISAWTSFYYQIFDGAKTLKSRGSFDKNVIVSSLLSFIHTIFYD
jgi:hypothetical protein